VIALLAALLLAGCPTEEPPPDGPAVDLGTGELDFEPLADGDRVAIVQGPQGGYHLYGSIRTVGVVAGDSRDLTDPTNPTMAFDVVHAGDSIIAVPPFTQGLDEAPPAQAPWTHWMLGREARLDLLFGEDATLDGETVDFSITVSDTDGTVVQDTVSVELYPHPLNGENAPG
jgi:hypothetical protein